MVNYSDYQTYVAWGDEWVILSCNRCPDRPLFLKTSVNHPTLQQLLDAADLHEAEQHPAQKEQGDHG